MICVQIRLTNQADRMDKFIVEFPEARALLEYIRSSFFSIHACSLERDKLPDFVEHITRRLDKNENFLPECDLYVLIHLTENYTWIVHIFEKSVLTEKSALCPSNENLRHVFKYELSEETFGEKFYVCFEMNGSPEKFRTPVPAHIEFALLHREELRSIHNTKKATIRKA